MPTHPTHAVVGKAECGEHTPVCDRALALDRLSRSDLILLVIGTEMQRAELLVALEPFAKYACDSPHVDEPMCHNCRAHAALAKARGAA